MKLLILGGTSYVGRHIVTEALHRGHEVSLFTRGKTNTQLFKDTEQLIGDRDGGLESLRDRYWDSVIDISGYFPRLVNDTAKLLHDSVRQYLFISTIAVYDALQICQNEDSPLINLGNISTEVLRDLTTYGGLKVLCEQTVNHFFPQRCTHLRLSNVAGPYDNSERFTYWLHRLSTEDPVAVPAKPTQAFQWIDARDLAEFTLLSVEQSIYGTFNLAHPPSNWAYWLSVCKECLSSDCSLHWIDNENFLRKTIELDDGYGAKIPLATTDKFSQLLKLDTTRAIDKGLQTRALEQTIKDIIAWDKQRKSRPKPVYTDMDERLLLDKWSRASRAQ